MDDHERELRRLRLEAREAQADVEDIEAELAASSALLGDMLRDWASHGRILRLDAVDRPRRGRLVHVGADVVTLLGDQGEREVISLHQVEGVAAVGISRSVLACTTGHPHSMLAHLRGLVGATPSVVVERRSTDPVSGVLVGVAKSHALVRTSVGDEVMVPIEAIVSVVSSRST